MNTVQIINKIDSIISQASVRLLGEHNGLSSFLFHSVSKTKKRSKFLYPQENLSLKLFDNFIQNFLELGYEFITPDEILSENLKPSQNYALLTFDDGYYNNFWLIDSLEKYQVPAVFFIPTYYIGNNEKLWADIIYTERSKQTCSLQQIKKEVDHLASKMFVPEIKDYITKEFGLEAFTPQGDEDRFFTTQELAQFAKNKYVILGNHTHSHEALAKLSEQEIENEISTSQKLLEELTGIAPKSISYPYGSYSPKVLNIVERHKFQLGVTTVQKKNALPLYNTFLELSRFNPIELNETFDYNKLRSPIQFKTTLKRIVQ